jgi:hypothetical protein
VRLVEQELVTAEDVPQARARLDFAKLHSGKLIDDLGPNRNVTRGRGAAGHPRQTGKCPDRRSALPAVHG